MAIYDAIGATYAETRRADPRIAEAIRSALGDATSVVNVGAGTGSYEPSNTVVAVEPSRVMVGQRPSGAVPVVRAVAEALPLRDKSVDAALAVLTVHHWSDVVAGIHEMRRVARRRIVFFTWRPEVIAEFWLLRDYLPEAAAADAGMAVPLNVLMAAAPESRFRVAAVPIPHDCTDGFGAAFWRRPWSYLKPVVRQSISMFATIDPVTLESGLNRLEADLESGRWQRTYAELLEREYLDAGYCTVTIDL